MGYAGEEHHLRILADSNIFIKYWKTKDKDIEDIMSKEDVVICGAVRAELMHGARSERELDGIKLVMDAFDELEMVEADWKQVGENLQKLRINGINLPFPDSIIATMGMKYDIPIWTFDQHFLRMKMVLTDMKLYDLAY